jgi:hypothetical protein
MATPAPRCSCCYAQRKSCGPESHGDGNYSSTTDDLTIPYQVGRFYLVLHCDTADDVLVVFIKNIPYTNTYYIIPERTVCRDAADAS